MNITIAQSLLLLLIKKHHGFNQNCMFVASSHLTRVKHMSHSSGHSVAIDRLLITNVATYNEDNTNWPSYIQWNLSMMVTVFGSHLYKTASLSDPKYIALNHCNLPL